MSTLAQDGTGDLLLTTTSGVKRFTVVTDPGQCAAQKLTNRFLMWVGEWYLDTRQGLQYFQFIAQKNPNLRALEQYFRKVVLSVPGIATIQQLSVTLNKQRQASMSLRAITNSGATIVGGPGPAFIVQP